MMEYTVKQISEYLEVTKPTVQKIVNDLEITPIRTDNRNCQYYSYQDAVRIIQNRNPDFDLSLLPEPQSETEKLQNKTEKLERENEKLETFSEKPQNQTAKSESKPQNQKEMQQASQTQSNNQRELDLLQELVKTIQKELEEKNKQLEIKDKQIQDLSDRLAEAMQLTRGQQYIAAADKTKDLIETGVPAADLDNTEPADLEYSEPPQKKKSFFARLFGL